MARRLTKLLGLGSAALFGLLILIQLIPYGRDHANPPVRNELPFNSPATKALARRACFNCHSNETVWPWYASVAPASWLVQHDVDEGRSKLNFSDWQGGTREGEKIAEIRDEVEEGSMPPFTYRLAHPEARLSDSERQQLLDGLAATIKR